MLPREMKVTTPDLATGPTAAFMRRNYHHFNARTIRDATEAYLRLLQRDGTMFLAMAGAMSTAEIGISLAPLIRARKVGGICVTGANLEEDVFNLVAHDEYVQLPQYQDLTPKEEQGLLKAHLNRVTDTAIPEQAAMTPIEDRIIELWKRAGMLGQRSFPHEYLYRLLQSGKLVPHYQIDPKTSWMLAAAEVNLPVFVPGWEDSTLGNVFTALVAKGEVNKVVVKSGIEYMLRLAEWYRATSKKGPMGFLQLGGGIAGDFSICVVPLLQQDMKEKGIPFWDYFAQVTEARVESGGYSGAFPAEKITWGKLTPKSAMFNIIGDASVIAPLMFDTVLGR